MRKEKKHSHLLLDDIVEILSLLVEITRQHIHNHLSASVLYQWRRQNAEKVTHSKGSLLDQAVILTNCILFQNGNFS